MTPQAYACGELKNESVMQKDLPRFLYKILSLQNWEKSQNKSSLALSDDDDQFIHFSLEVQLERIIQKYWHHIPEFIILKIDPSKLPGRLVLEANPGGENKYYHLYDGSIPLSAIVEAKTIAKV